MSLKAKLVSTIAAFCMVICLLSVGIWAASTGTVTLGGSVSFVAEDVNVKVEYVGMEGGTGTYSHDAIIWNSSKEPNAENDKFEGMNFGFKKDAENAAAYDEIVITLKVTNLSQERGVTVTFSAAKTGATGNDASVTVETDGATSIAKATTAEGISELYTITIKTTKSTNESVAATAWAGTLKVDNVKA